jgi:hypothetical protein
MQFVALLHETPLRLIESGGTASGVHALPFHDSVFLPPIAMHPAAEVQEIAVGPPGGAGSTVHAEPFQDAARVPGSAKPTATQFVALAHEMPDRPVLELASGASGSLVQLWPFQDSASAAKVLFETSYVPTAMQLVLLTHETEDRLT